jgi:ABC-2 type transport system ATP-binding protein
MSEQSLIECKNLSVAFGRKKVLENINLSISPGEFIGLIGISGSGKSTLIKSLLGLLRSSGDVYFKGKSISLAKSHYLNQAGYCTQQNSFYESLTVLENLRYFSLFYNIPSKAFKKNLSEIINLTNLGDSLHVVAKKLSGGMKRRLDLACALISSPEILFLDEPLSGLDTIRKSNILFILKKVNSLRKTIVFSTHNLSDVESLCSRIIVIKEGKIIEDSSKEELVSKYSFVYKILIRMSDKNKGLEQQLLYRLKKKELKILGSFKLGEQLSLYVTEPDIAAEEISAFFASNNAAFSWISMMKPTLSEIFKMIYFEELKNMTKIPLSESEKESLLSEVSALRKDFSDDEIFQYFCRLGIDAHIVSEVLARRN